MNRDQFKSKLDPAPEVEHLRGEVQHLEGLLTAKKNTTGQISEAMNSVLEAVRVATPDVLPLTEVGNPAGSPVTHVVQITDWHIGQRTNPEHIEEFGEFNYATAVRRVDHLSSSIINKTITARNSYIVEDCHVIGTADWVNGDIHDEFIRTNEFPTPVAAVKSGYLIGTFVEGLAKHFRRVKVDLLTAGNHDRITKKNQAEDGGLNSWGYISCEIAKQYLSTLPNVEVHVHVSLSTVISVASQRYLIAHGHGIMGTWGIPFYGIERKKQKEAMARMNMPVEKHFDKIIIGHFHTALNHEHWLIGGSLTGTGAFDHQEGRHSRAHQTSWFVHPKYGEFDWTRWFL